MTSGTGAWTPIGSDAFSPTPTTAHLPAALLSCPGASLALLQLPLHHHHHACAHTRTCIHMPPPPLQAQRFTWESILANIFLFRIHDYVEQVGGGMGCVSMCVCGWVCGWGHAALLCGPDCDVLWQCRVMGDLTPTTTGIRVVGGVVGGWVMAGCHWLLGVGVWEPGGSSPVAVSSRGYGMG